MVDTFLASLFYALPEPLWIALGIGVGFLVGSFLNVVIHRLPRMMERGWQTDCRALLLDNAKESPLSAETEPETYNLIRPRSNCPHCQHAITALENIPLISYLFLGGRCAVCKAAISWRYPLVELLGGLIVLAFFLAYGISVQAFWGIIFAWGLLALTFIDFEHQLLPDQITLPFLWLGLLLNSFSLYVTLEDAVYGAVGGYLIFWVIFHLFRLITGKEGMGYGDFKLMAMIGAWFGWAVLPWVVLLSSLLGATVGITLILLFRHDRRQPIPFGPYLALAGLIVSITHPKLLAWLHSGYWF